MRNRKIFSLVIIITLLFMLLVVATACEKPETNNDEIPFVTGSLVERWEGLKPLMTTVWKEETTEFNEEEDSYFGCYSKKLGSIELSYLTDGEGGYVYAFECDEDAYNSEEVINFLKTYNEYDEYYMDDYIKFKRIPDTNIYASDRWGIINYLSNDVQKIGDAYYSKDKTRLLSYLGNDSTFKFLDETVEIADGTFYSCKNLINITIPNSVTKIGIGMFRECSGLTSVTIPNGVTHIDFRAFRGCTSLASVTLPSNLSYIAFGSFKDCTSLRDITIPSGVKYIGLEAFSGCYGLKNITIPDTVTVVDYNAFVDTAWFENQPDGVVYAGKVAYKYKGEMPENTTITIKDGTVAISAEAFAPYENLTNVVIPNTVARIGRAAFYGTAWFENKHNELVYANNKVVYRYKGEMPENTKIVINDGIISLTEYAFYDCKNLVSIEIPKSVTSIGIYEFLKCSNLTKIIYKGTKDEFKAIKKGYGWNFETSLEEIVCTDGKLTVF